MNSQREHIESLFTPQPSPAGWVSPPLEGERLSALERELTTLRAALETRDTIGMAKGILMAREHCGPDDAFDILRRASQRVNRKLADIAADIVASTAEGTPPAHNRPPR